MDKASSSQSADQQALAAGNSRFALDLYGRLCTAQGNLFFSPYSISAALAMTYAGARGNTASQMAAVLHFALDPERLHPAFAGLEVLLESWQKAGRIALSVANSLWPQLGERFKRAYLDLVLHYYGVTITAVDYARDPEGSRQRINAWVEDKTQEKIKELILPQHVSGPSVLILVNAIYFKGDWASQFDAANTRPAPFYVTAEKSVEVSLMRQKASFGYAELPGLQVLELPYQGDELSMVVLLPQAGNGLAELEQAFSLENLANWLGRLRVQEVDVLLPRFKLTGQFELKDVLEAMGMTDAFGLADFSGMTTGQLFISNVVHKAFVEVNEEGTEAAAATAVVFARGLPLPAPVFRADRPFLFLIRERSSGSILFLGRLADPEA